MNVARFARRHSRAVILFTCLLSGAGVIASQSLPSDIYPPLTFPRIVIIAHTGSTPSQSMMVTVTRPLEQAVMEVPGVRRVRSRTFRGSAEISAQFESTTDMARALQQVQNRVAETQPDLPLDTSLTVDRLTPSTFPFFSMDLTGGLSSADLRDYAFYVVRPTLARVAGIGHVEVLSSDTREIEVVTDPRKLLAAGLTVGDVSSSLKNTNQLTPAGRYIKEGIQHLALASGLWASAAAIADTPIVVKNGTTLRVRDVATVSPGTPDRTMLIVGGGQDAAAISASLQIGANILTVKRGVERALGDLARTLPAGLTLTKTYDLAEFVDTSIANVRDAILIGGVLAVCILLLFLRNIRLTIIAASTLPLTVLMTFFFMWLVGESINVMSMGGLAVAIGLVIDDAVVVVENIHRRIKEGVEAVDLAVSELVAPVVGSTLATVVVFAPLGMLSGVVGQFFVALSVTLTAAVLTSLLLSLTLIPLLARAFADRAHAESDADIGHGPSALSAWYVSTLSRWTRRPIVALVAVLCLALVAVLTYTRIGSGFLPAADEGGFVVDYLTPSGSALEETDARVRRMEAILTKTAEVATISRRTGSELGLFATQQNSGDILVRLKGRSERSRSAEEIIEGVREQLQEVVPDTEIEFVQLLQDMLGDLEGNPNPIEVKVFGDDPAVLAEVAADVETRIEKIDGLVDVVGPSEGNPETTWQIDPVMAGQLGLSVDDVSRQMASAWSGDIATDLRLLDRTIPVRVHYPDSDRFAVQRLADTTIRAANGRTIPLSAIATMHTETGQEELLRENLRQMGLVTARLEQRDLGSGVADIQTALRDMRLPLGYTIEIGGQYEAQRQAFRQLLFVSGLAMSLVFAILVVQFRRFTAALLIIAAAPLSLGGAFLLLIATNTELNVSSAMGLILLVGLAVKNSIVLLDFVDNRRAEGASARDAVFAAAQIRLRPILMTTLCTLFGLAPLAIGLGAGAELQKPLALAVIGGLTVSTFVTLYLVPAAYLAIEGRREGRQRNRVS